MTDPEKNPENWKTAKAPDNRIYYYNKVVNNFFEK